MSGRLSAQKRLATNNLKLAAAVKTTRNAQAPELDPQILLLKAENLAVNFHSALSRQLSVFFLHLHLPLQSSYATYLRSGFHGVQVVFKRQKLFKEITVTRSCSVVII
jgi:hypothetical protein